MRLYYVANARMPTDKAHGIQIAKMCEAFIEEGVDVTLVLPRRSGTEQSLREYYGLRVDIPVVKLPALDSHNRGPLLYRISALSFVCSYLWYFYTAVARADAVVYTVDLDHVTYLGLPLLGLPYFSEMHGGKPRSLLYRIFFGKIRGTIATTAITRDELIGRFSLRKEQVLLESNGVDLTHLSPLSREDARRALGLPLEKTLALYVGRVLPWKGIDILPAVASQLPHITIGFLGGTADEFKSRFGSSGEPVVFYGSKPHTEVGVWLAAADVCIVLGTKRDDYSYRYTSPMKIFEYLASGRPIIASATPALRGVLAEDECFFSEPDSATSLVAAIKDVIADPARAKRIADAGVHRAHEHTWQRRAQRIGTFIQRLAHTS